MGGDSWADVQHGDRRPVIAALPDQLPHCPRRPKHVGMLSERLAGPGRQRESRDSAEQQGKHSYTHTDLHQLVDRGQAVHHPTRAAFDCRCRDWSVEVGLLLILHYPFICQQVDPQAALWRAAETSVM